MDEPAFIAGLRAIATTPAARGLADDAAVLDGLVLTHDMLVEGVHYLPHDPPQDVAWKLVATNLSDLAAKGAVPVGVLMGFMLGDDAWDRAFLDGLARVLRRFDCALLGGDTVRGHGGPRALGLTAIGRAGPVVPSRSGARDGDSLWVAGVIGDAGLGLAMARDGRPGDPRFLAAYRTPVPLVADGIALAPHVSAMMDVSDGLLIDAARMGEASGLAVTIDLDAVPLSAEACAHGLDPLAAAVSGDDYALLFACAGVPPVAATAAGRFSVGDGLSLHRSGVAVPLPARLGWLHG